MLMAAFPVPSATFTCNSGGVGEGEAMDRDGDGEHEALCSTLGGLGSVEDGFEMLVLADFLKDFFLHSWTSGCTYF